MLSRLQFPLTLEQDRIIKVRKLAALDIAFFGPRLILLEYGLGVLLLTVFGAYIILSGRGSSQSISPFGLYLVTLGVDYVPLLVYAIKIHGKERAKAEVGMELMEAGKARRKYSLQQLLLLVPFAIPILAVVQEWA